MPSTPGLPLLALTRFNACLQFSRSQTSSINCSAMAGLSVPRFPADDSVPSWRPFGGQGRSLDPQSGFPNKRKISRGKLDCLPHATAEFTTSALDGYGLRGHSPARPALHASDPVLVHRLVRLLHASFRPSVTGTPLRFATTSPPSGCRGDFHPRAVEHARHTKDGGGRLVRLPPPGLYSCFV